MNTIMLGRVKWFNADKGYGFIESGSGKDVFVHYSDIVSKNFRALNEGQKVIYSIVRGKRGLMAQSVRPLY